MASQTRIHPTAQVHPRAKIGSNVTIGAFAYIDEHVVIHDGVTVGPFALLTGRTVIGAGTKVGAHAALGTKPQDLKYKDEPTQLIIGQNNDFREYTNVSVGTPNGGEITKIGDHNLIMAYTHIGHDCQVGNHCLFVNNVSIAGHVQIGNHVVFAGNSGSHQYRRIGDLCMISSLSVVHKDLVPFALVDGRRAAIVAPNVVGMRKVGYSRDTIKDIKRLFTLTFKSGSSLEDVIIKLQDELNPELYHRNFLSFLQGVKVDHLVTFRSRTMRSTRAEVFA